MTKIAKLVIQAIELSKGRRFTLNLDRELVCSILDRLNVSIPKELIQDDHALTPSMKFILSDIHKNGPLYYSVDRVIQRMGGRRVSTGTTISYWRPYSSMRDRTHADSRAINCLLRRKLLIRERDRSLPYATTVTQYKYSLSPEGLEVVLR